MVKIWVAPDRVEAVARQMCRNAGQDPDREWVLVPRRRKPLKLGSLNAFDSAHATTLPAWRAFQEPARAALQAAADVDATAAPRT